MASRSPESRKDARIEEIGIEEIAAWEALGSLDLRPPDPSVKMVMCSPINCVPFIIN